MYVICIYVYHISVYLCIRIYIYSFCVHYELLNLGSSVVNWPPKKREKHRMHLPPDPRLLILGATHRQMHARPTVNLTEGINGCHLASGNMASWEIHHTWKFIWEKQLYRLYQIIIVRGIIDSHRFSTLSHIFGDINGFLSGKPSPKRSFKRKHGWNMLEPSILHRNSWGDSKQFLHSTKSCEVIRSH